MSRAKTYILEYWIDLNQFSEEQLKNHVKQSLGKAVDKVKFKIQEKEKHLILRITSTDKGIDSCHDKLDFDREWVFRTKDELGESLRTSAYPLLAEIELQLRGFIQQAMINVLGFDWWNSFIPEKIREKVNAIEAKAKKHQVKSQHSIEFTFFEDLIGLVTTEFQAWSSDYSLTVNDLWELLSISNSIDEIRKEVDSRRKVVSFWDDVFSDYFDDKESWTQLKKSIEKTIIPLRNKVMHHRLIRCHEVVELKQLRDEVQRVLGLAKTSLSDLELEEVQPNIKVITDKLKSQFDNEELKKSMLGLNIGALAGINSIEELKKSMLGPNIGALAGINGIEELKKSMLGPNIGALAGINGIEELKKSMLGLNIGALAGINSIEELKKSMLGPNIEALAGINSIEELKKSMLGPNVGALAGINGIEELKKSMLGLNIPSSQEEPDENEGKGD